MKKDMKRREFLKLSACGLTAVALGPTLLSCGGGGSGGAAPDEPVVPAEPVVLNLGMTTADVEMVDGILVPHWVYTVNGAPTLPGPAIFAFETDAIQINVTNDIGDRDRGFAIVSNDFAGNPFALVKQTGAIPAGATGSVVINPGDLRPGTYLYKDPTMDPVSRVLGLHGPLVILPSPTATNPYGAFSSPNATRLFNALGVGIPRDPEAFAPGQPWFATTDANPNYGLSDSDHHHHEHFVMDPNGPQSHVFERFLYRNRIWLHSSIDPVLNRAVITDGIIPDPAAVKDNFLPQYFSINGRQGAFASHSPDVVPIGTVGEPHVIRLLNAGLVNHSPHLHANHIYVVSVNNVVGSGGVYFGTDPAADHIFFVDTMTLGPEDRIDWVIPFIRPPDIPWVLENGTLLRPVEPANGRLLMPLNQLLAEELSLVLIVPQNPLSWPMHSHMELDQTAAGGNYPQGAVTGWEMTGEFGEDFDIL